MQKFFNILQKEIKDLLTLKMILPFIMSIFLLFFIGQVMQSEIGRAVRPLSIGIIDWDRTPYSLSLIEGLKTTQNKVIMIDALKTINQQASASFIKDLDPNLNPVILREPIKVMEFVVLKNLIQPGNAGFIIAYISTQTVIVPVALLMLIIITGTMSLGLKIFTFLIPFSHTFFAFKFLLLGQRLPVVFGIIYLSLFTAVLLFVATKVFSSEKILTMKFSFGRFFKQ